MPISLLSVIIVEDQPEISSYISSLVERRPGLLIAGRCNNVEDASILIDKEKPDLLLLDIHLPDGTAFDLLNKIKHSCRTIFLTAYEEHAIKAIKYGALDYLLKPINEEEFYQALSKVDDIIPAGADQLMIANGYHNDRVKTKLILRSTDYLQIVEIKDIVYCHSHEGYTTFHLKDDTKIMVTRIIKEYEDILTEPTFIRTHQSYLVNHHFIEKYLKEGFLVLKNKTEIPVATRRKEAVLFFLSNL